MVKKLAGMVVVNDLDRAYGVPDARIVMAMASMINALPSASF
jgi:hypothetical protein